MFTLLETVTTGLNASITITPETYHRHLRLVFRSRTNNAVVNGNLLLRLNGDVGANYDWHQVQGNTGAGQFGNALAATSMQIGTIPGASAPANLHSVTIVDIPDYGFTDFEKLVTSVNTHKDGIATNANLRVATHMGAWRNAAAITSITVLPSAGSFVIGTSITLYGYGS